MNSTTSSIVGALGGGSGVDMVKLAGDLSAARFAPRIAQLEGRAEQLDLRISSAGALKSSLTQLASALGERIRTGDLAPRIAVGNAAVATASVSPGGVAEGSYSLEVTRLASRQMLALSPFGSAQDPVGEGTLTFRFGTVDGGSFNEDAARPVLQIAISASDTLEDVARAVNLAGGSLSAYVANGAEGAQLVLKGQDGAMNGFTVEGSGASASGAPGAGNIDYLNWNPATDSGQIKAAAADAAFTLDGIAMTSPSNNVTGLPQGLNLVLQGTNAGSPTALTFSDRGPQIESVVNDLVLAMNDIAAQLKQNADPLGGELGNDPGARTLKRELAGLAGRTVMPNAAPGAPRTLGDLGLVYDRDGTFRLDTQRLKNTLARSPAESTAMFTTGFHGVYASIDNLARSAGASMNPGSIGGSVRRYTAQREKIGEQLTDIAIQQDTLRSQMVKNFAWADRNVAQSQSTLSFLQGQIAIWNADRG
ncbi:flagellar filament capping protein FliD [Pseudopontixanthobacter vadosimaris]|uniref:flagellar filament capping protein FliD n=1 Tax=Pseudopontixanthobacter vadosimaris TaxID=2726450 RepID=UPI001475385F|nr:flagellar filament capping protein FliD [Pseudopontixanthobacter vadosimaris]